MKLKHFWSAAAVIWGCIALGHDHETGGGDLEISCPVGPCSMECQAYGRCLVECLTGGICPSEGDTTCPTERRLWVLCLEDNQTTIPPGRFGGIIIGGPVTPPSNECGDDEIGGGETPCEKCGEGEVPNGEKTACVAECGWDQIADPASGRCVLRPFDDEAKALAARVGNCGAPTVSGYLDHRLVSSVSYGLPEVRGHYGSAGCGPKGNNPPTTLVVKLNRAALEKSGRSTSSAWHWASVAVIHEFIHVRDFIEYDSCAPWYTLKGLRAVTGAGYPSSLDGFEGWTDERTNTEYLNTFGFMSPEDRRHVAAVDNKPLPCLFD